VYQVATGIMSEGDIAPTQDDLRKQKKVRVLLGDVTAIDLKEDVSGSCGLQRCRYTPDVARARRSYSATTSCHLRARMKTMTMRWSCGPISGVRGRGDTTRPTGNALDVVVVGAGRTA